MKTKLRLYMLHAAIRPNRMTDRNKKKTQSLSVSYSSESPPDVGLVAPLDPPGLLLSKLDRDLVAVVQAHGQELDDAIVHERDFDFR